jgi:hypothetical protein
MINLYNDYYLFSDKYNWILREQFTGEDKQGNPKESFRDLGYFRTVEQACRRMVDLDSKSSDSIQELIETIKSSTSRIIKATEGVEK